MGFNNGGRYQLYQTLKRFRDRYPDSKLKIITSIGKNKTTPNEYAADDYMRCYSTLYEVSDAFVVNVSSPNTPNLRKLQDISFLEKLLDRIDQRNVTERWDRKPIAFKVAPDLSDEAYIQLVEFCQNDDRISFLIVANTTNGRNYLRTSQDRIDEIGNGGLSGKLVYDRMIELVKLARHHGFAKDIIAVGGINSPGRAVMARQAGADCVQSYTGMVYNGPILLRKIQKRLSEYIKMAA